MIRLLSCFLRPYWRVVVTTPDGREIALPKRHRRIGDARFERLVHELVMADAGYRYELRRYR